MGRFDAPLPIKLTDSMFKTWSSFIKRRECASIIALPRFDRLYRIPQFITWYQTTIQDNTQCVSVSFQALASEEWKSIKHSLDTLRGEYVHTTFLVNDPEWLLNNSPHIIPELSKYIRQRHPSTSCIFFFEKNIYDPQYSALLQDYPFIYQNVWYQRLYDREDMLHFTQYLQQAHSLSIDQTIVLDILEHCGGYFCLFRESLRYACEYHVISYTHDAFLFRLRTIWDKFDSDEQMVLKRVVQNAPIDDAFHEALHYLQKTGLITEKMQISVPVVRTYIENVINAETILSLDVRGHIYVGPVCIDTSLSPIEKKLLHFFLSHRDEIISREQTAEMIWGKDRGDSFSDWNLDQSIKRLRSRLHALGIAKEIIRTVKKKGYYVNC